jgi:hypothetical protein
MNNAGLDNYWLFPSMNYYSVDATGVPLVRRCQPPPCPRASGDLYAYARDRASCAHGAGMVRHTGGVMISPSLRLVRGVSVRVWEGAAIRGGPFAFATLVRHDWCRMPWPRSVSSRWTHLNLLIP